MQVSPHILPALLLLGLLTGCGEGLRLEGSVTSLLDLHYERAEALATEDEASVSFLNHQGAGENTILKVSAVLDGLVLTPGVPVDLAELLGEEEDAPQRGSVSRNVKPTREFPRILRGTLTFDKALSPTAKVPGNFHVTFVNGTDVYSGRTIFGRFEAIVP